MHLKRTVCTFLIALLLLNIFTGCQETPASTTSAETEPTATLQTFPAETTEPYVPVEPKDVVVHEVMADNSLLCMGHGFDWVELYNREEEPVLLDGYYLSDDLEQPHAMPLSGLTVPAESYLVINLDDEAAFRLSSGGESVFLFCEDTLISELAFPADTDGMSVDAGGICPWPTPGYANTVDGYYAYLEGQSLPALSISEAMSSNSKFLPVGRECFDLVEIRNNSEEPINLLGYYLSDKKREPQRYAFPDITLGPGDYCVVYCSGEPALGAEHASFKLSADGETLYLSKADAFVDALRIPSDLGKNESYGRVGNVPMYLRTPTFGEDNADGFLTGLEAPQASLASGFYADSFALTLAAEGEIYYTLDGKRPSTYSRRYTEPITVEGTVTVRTICVSEGRTSAEARYTYVVGAEHDLPVVVVSIPQSYLTGEKGILEDIRRNREEEAVVTLLENGAEQFSVPCGFRLHGYGSRECNKQNFQLRFRSEYGVSKLHYQVFADLDIDSFNSLLLKGGSEDWLAAVMRDEMATLVVKDTNVYTQAMKPVALYLGGRYWGVYYIRERFSDDYVASHLGVSEESVDLVESSSAMTQSGSNKDFLALREYCQTHDMSLEENYTYLCAKIDVLSLMDWYICRSFQGDRDINNIRRFRSDESDGLWRWMYFDLDWAFYNKNGAYFSVQVGDYNADRVLMRAAIASSTGRDLFLKRCAELLATVHTEEAYNAAIDSIVSQIDSEMIRDRQRWGTSYERWQESVEKMRAYVSGGTRMQGFLQDLRKYFSLTDEEMQSYFGQLLS